MEQNSLSAARLYQRHGPAVARFLRSRGVRQQDCDDLVQEVFLVAHRRGGFDPGDAQPFTWLAEIASRLAYADGRRRRRRGEILDEDALAEAPAPAASPADAIEAAEARDHVRAALDAMETDKRNILISFEVEGRPCETIADDLGVPVGTVYSRLHKARKDLARALQRAWCQPP
jgi:RNA polymerase sigma-70 factor, ECF subfamily